MPRSVPKISARALLLTAAASLTVRTLSAQDRAVGSGEFRFGDAVIWLKASENGNVLLYASRRYRDALQRPIVLPVDAVESWADTTEAIAALPRGERNRKERIVQAPDLAGGYVWFQRRVGGPYPAIQLSFADPSGPLTCRLTEEDTRRLVAGMREAARLTRRLMSGDVAVLARAEGPTVEAPLPQERRPTVLEPPVAEKPPVTVARPTASPKQPAPPPPAAAPAPAPAPAPKTVAAAPPPAQAQPAAAPTARAPARLDSAPAKPAAVAAAARPAKDTAARVDSVPPPPTVTVLGVAVRPKPAPEPVAQAAPQPAAQPAAPEVGASIPAPSDTAVRVTPGSASAAPRSRSPREAVSPVRPGPRPSSASSRAKITVAATDTTPPIAAPAEAGVQVTTAAPSELPRPKSAKAATATRPPRPTAVAPAPSVVAAVDSAPSIAPPAERDVHVTTARREPSGKPTEDALSLIPAKSVYPDQLKWSEDDVTRPLARVAQMQFCYQEYGLKLYPKLWGVVSIVVKLKESGEVSSANIQRHRWSEPGMKDVEQCMVSRIKAWKLYQHEIGDGVQTLTYSFRQ